MLATAVTTDNPNVTQWGQSYTYDGFGNLTDQTVIKGSAPTMHVAYNTSTNRQTGDSAEAAYAFRQATGIERDRGSDQSQSLVTGLSVTTISRSSGLYVFLYDKCGEPADHAHRADRRINNLRRVNTGPKFDPLLQHH